MKRMLLLLTALITLACSAHSTPAADWNKPQLTDTYTNFLGYLNGRLNDVATGFSSTPTNQPTGAIRWNAGTSKWEKWSGSSWGDLSTLYSINIGGNAATATTATSATTAANATTHIAAATGAEHGAAAANTANMIVRRDASGNFAAGTITANITGNVSGSSGSCTGNAATATSATSAGTAASATTATNASGSGTIPLARYANGLRIMYGEIHITGATNPTVIAGSGFGVNRIGVGTYRISLNNTFSGPATIIPSANTLARVLASSGTSYLDLATVDTSSALYDSADTYLHFIIVGPN